MAEHPPEQHIQKGEKAAKQADPHGMGKQGAQEERGNHEAKGQPTSTRQDTENASGDGSHS